MNIDELFKKIAADREAKAAAPITYIVAGLGNPGKEYDGTRHNTGFAAIDFIAEKAGASESACFVMPVSCSTLKCIFR